MNTKEIQQYLIDHKIDGWLLSDFHGRNDVCVNLLKLDGMISRRSFFFIPAEGEPVAVVHQVDIGRFETMTCRKIMFSDYQTLENELAALLDDCDKVAMEYSPNGRLPYIGLVDAGTIELIRSFGCEVISSADIVANFQARLTPEQIATHRIAAHNIVEIKEKAFAFIKETLDNNQRLTEFDVISYVLKQIKEYDMETEHSPICGVGKNGGNPHYEPTADNCAEIKKGELVLLDLWGKLKHPDGVFADITWMCFTGPKEDIPQRFVDLFKVLTTARDAAIQFIRDRIDSQPVYGAEVDDVCRDVITKAGHGEFFRHRTGHSITTAIHGAGPNIDNHETEDNRRLQKGHLFSIEPGIYPGDCGLRTEVDVLIGYDGVEVATQPLQQEIVALY